MSFYQIPCSNLIQRFLAPKRTVSKELQIITVALGRRRERVQSAANPALMIQLTKDFIHSFQKVDNRIFRRTRKKRIF